MRTTNLLRYMTITYSAFFLLFFHSYITGIDTTLYSPQPPHSSPSTPPIQTPSYYSRHLKDKRPILYATLGTGLLFMGAGYYLYRRHHQPPQPTPQQPSISPNLLTPRAEGDQKHDGIRPLRYVDRILVRSKTVGSSPSFSKQYRTWVQEIIAFTKNQHTERPYHTINRSHFTKGNAAYIRLTGYSEGTSSLKEIGTICTFSKETAAFLALDENLSSDTQNSSLGTIVIKIIMHSNDTNTTYSTIRTKIRIGGIMPSIDSEALDLTLSPNGDYLALLYKKKPRNTDSYKITAYVYQRNTPHYYYNDGDPIITHSYYKNIATDSTSTTDIPTVQFSSNSTQLLMPQDDYGSYVIYSLPQKAIIQKCVLYQKPTDEPRPHYELFAWNADQNTILTFDGNQTLYYHNIQGKLLGSNLIQAIRAIKIDHKGNFIICDSNPEKRWYYIIPSDGTSTWNTIPLLEDNDISQRSVDPGNMILFDKAAVFIDTDTITEYTG